MKNNPVWRMGLLYIFILMFFLSNIGFAQYVAGSTSVKQEDESRAVSKNEKSKDGSYQWHDKLKRGAINIISSIVEIPKQIHDRTESDSLAMGWTVGILEGMGHGIMRLGSGVIDLLTFPFNFPKTNKGPLIQPEYVWQSSDVRYV